MSINQNFDIKNFLEYFGSKHFRGLSRVQSLPVLHQQNVVRKLRREIYVVSNNQG
jgi:hypothetical protein